MSTFTCAVPTYVPTTTTPYEPTEQQQQQDPAIEHIACAYCGEVYPETELMSIDDDTSEALFCSECHPNMVLCDYCNEPHHDDELYFVRGGNDFDGFVCEDCLDAHYTRCHSCGEFFQTGDTTSIGEYDYCPDCRDEHFSRCDGCGDYIPNADAYYDDDSEETLCPECYRDREHVILAYHSNRRPDVEFFKTSSDLPNPLYFGVELEVDNGGEDHDNAAMILSELGTEHAFAEHDGSLSNGFEIISQPFTLAYYNDTLSTRYLAAMSLAANLGYRSHDTNTCGLHIHVGRRGLGATQDEQEDTITKIWVLMYRFRHIFQDLTRRDPAKLIRWAEMPILGDLGDMDDETCRNSDLPTLKYKLKRNGSCVRYRALNLTPTNTIEFRLFRGTLKHSTFTATLQFVHNLCAVAMALTGTDALKITWAQLHALLIIDAPELKEYILARGVAPRPDIPEAE